MFINKICQSTTLIKFREKEVPAEFILFNDMQQLKGCLIWWGEIYYVDLKI